MNEIGYYESGGMGIVVISYKEIQSFSEMTKRPLTPLEVKMIRTISRNYVNQSNTNYKGIEAPYQHSENRILFASDNKIRKSLGLI